MTSALLESYRTCRYELHLPTGTIHLAVDQHCPPLGDLLRAAGCTSAAWLTAFNPGSQLGTETQNSDSQKRLERRLQRACYRLISGTAVDPAGHWPPEPSLFVPGMLLGDAESTARDFGQLAFLWIEADAVPRLVEAAQSPR
jgi:Protein of unknown function (DUF3293)